MSFKTTACLMFSALILAACSPDKHNVASGVDDPQQPESSEAYGVVRATAYMDVDIGANGEITPSARASYPVTIVNPPSVTFNIDTSRMVVPAISNTMLNFGKIAISALVDNQLRICGSNSKKKCGQAFIRMYTTGTAGAGIWNAEGGYGMPIYANKTGSAQLTVGLDAARAAVVQTVAIPANKNVLRLTDFPTPAYEMRSDFTEAGAGSYSTTLVIEYGLLE